MGVVNPTYPKPRPTGVQYVLWSGLTASDTGLPVSFPKHSDKTVSIFGTFGGAITMEGTDDVRGDPSHADHVNAAWVPLTDSLDAAAISKTANAGEVLLQNYKWIRPKAAAGVSAVSVAMTCRKDR